MTADPTLLELREQRELLARGALSSVELVQAQLRRIDAATELNAFVHVATDAALAAARAADAARAAGDARPLLGLPLAHKDVFVTRDMPSTAGSKMLAGYMSPFDATIVQRLAQAGAISVGKTNMDEFAMGSANENSAFGPVANPWDRATVPGGSSGGSAAAVAARLVPAATGSDTGGSIRQPAAMCGVTGVKPTYGLCSRFGMIAFASSLDQAGVMARSAWDCALLLQDMAGHDAQDSTSVAQPVPRYTDALDALPAQRPLEGLRIGLPREWFADGLADEVAHAVRGALAELERLGATLLDISLPRTELAIPAYYIVAPAEASSNLSRYDGVRYGHRAADYADLAEMYAATRAEGFGAEVKRRILIGTYVLSHGYYDAYYLQAQKIRRLIADDFTAAFAGCDLIAGPVSPTVAWSRGAKADPLANYLADIYTLPGSLAGLPGLSTPAGLGRDSGLPVGLQLLAPHFGEARLLGAAHALQRATDWHRLVPPTL
jgi:aspartyl-tRNA(Asn)/glutamyl-tRNA(Gln) amidotransferase subunit A